jgi:hypothetical protein
LIVVGGINVSENAIISGPTNILDTTQSNSDTTGALIVAGGAGISGNLYVGTDLNVTGQGTVTLSPSTSNVIIEPSLGGTVTIRPTTTPGSINNMVIGSTDPEDATFVNVDINSTATSTSTTTGALTVAGGVGIQGDIYSNTGIPAENYLLYTPRVSVTAGIAPTSPRIGDFWIDSTIPAYLQYIQDGTSTFWIQVGAV